MLIHFMFFWWSQVVNHSLHHPPSSSGSNVPPFGFVPACFGLVAKTAFQDELLAYNLMFLLKLYKLNRPFVNDCKPGRVLGFSFLHKVAKPKILLEREVSTELFAGKEKP